MHRPTCSLRAIETAPRIDTSTSGSSRVASALALYTLAPASLTTAQATLSPRPCASQELNLNVSVRTAHRKDGVLRCELIASNIHTPLM